MNVSKPFLRDFAYLANRYEWTPADIEEIKAAVRAYPETGKRYITALSAAHRAGYEQTPGNAYIRLDAWCAAHGMPDPYLTNPATTENSPKEATK